MTAIGTALSNAFHRLIHSVSGDRNTADIDALPQSKQEECPPLFTVAPMPLTGNKEADSSISHYNAALAKVLAAKNETRTENRPDMSETYRYKSKVVENTAARRVVEIVDNTDTALNDETLSLEPGGNLKDRGTCSANPRHGIGLTSGSSAGDTYIWTRNADGSLQEKVHRWMNCAVFDGSIISTRYVNTIHPNGKVDSTLEP